MTTCIYIENILGSGQVVTVFEDFSDYSVSRDLQPGENTRVVISPFKSIRVREMPGDGALNVLPAEIRALAKAACEGLVLRN